MKPSFDWPVTFEHEPCRLSNTIFPLVEKVTINRRGVLTFRLFCCECDVRYTIAHTVLDLVANAAIQDNAFIGWFNPTRTD